MVDVDIGIGRENVERGVGEVGLEKVGHNYFRHVLLDRGADDRAGAICRHRLVTIHPDTSS
jgi:hypothetical protein